MKSKKVNKLLLLVLSLGLTGCFALTPYSLNEIEIGMTKSEVKEIMGRPYTSKSGNGKDYMVYYLHHDFFDFFMNIKKFPFIGFYPFLRTGQEYYVVFEGDKVISQGDRKSYKGSIMKDKEGSIEFLLED